MEDKLFYAYLKYQKESVNVNEKVSRALMNF